MPSNTLRTLYNSEIDLKPPINELGNVSHIVSGVSVSFAKWNLLDFPREFDDELLKHCGLLELDTAEWLCVPNNKYMYQHCASAWDVLSKWVLNGKFNFTKSRQQHNNSTCKGYLCVECCTCLGAMHIFPSHVFYKMEK